mgnify:FL=1
MLEITRSFATVFLYFRETPPDYGGSQKREILVQKLMGALKVATIIIDNQNPGH